MQGDAPTKEKLDEVALDLIDESPSNPRKHFDAAKLSELAADIAANGITQPVVVRARDGGRFELVVGARRTRASKMAGRTTILAIVRNIGDRATLEVQLSENANRQDVHPLEEADGYAQLIEVHHATIDEVAAKVGKPAGYVRHRLQYRALCPAGRDAFFAGKLSPHTALLVARIPVESLQVQAVKDITGGRWNGDAMNAREAGEHIRGHFMLRLADAPFDRGDATLVPAAGACTVCPKRTGNQAELFADVNSPDVCTDPECFSGKKDADWQRRTEAAKAKGHAVLSAKASKEVFHYGGNVAHNADYVDLSQKPWDVGDGKKKTYKSLFEGALPPITIARDGEGGVHELVKKDDLKKALKAAGLEKAAPRSSSGDEKKKIRERQERQRAVVRTAMAKVVEAAESKPPSDTLWMFLAETFTRASWHDVLVDVVKRRGLSAPPKKGSQKATARPEELVLTALKTMKPGAVRGIIVEILATRGAVPMYSGEQYGEDLRHACDIFGVNLSAIAGEVKAERVAAKKAKGKKGAKGKASASKGKPARARRPAEDEGDDGDEEEGDEPELGDDDGDDDPEDETETRVWVAMAAWDALAVESRVHIEEPIVGAEVGWHELDVYMTAVVPGAELLEALRSECKARGVALHEGEERPAADAPPAADSVDVAALLSRYQKAGRLVLDLGVVPGADLDAHDPGQRAVREQWNAAHPDARVSVPEASKAGAKKARAKKAVA